MKRREQIPAWILLSVFVPMVLLSCFHFHSIPSVPVDCDDCLEHVHHPGHITQDSATVDECLLCRFLSQRFVAPAGLPELKVDAVLISLVAEPLTEAFIDVCYGVPTLRAPPTIL